MTLFFASNSIATENDVIIQDLARKLKIANGARTLEQFCMHKSGNIDAFDYYLQKFNSFAKEEMTESEYRNIQESAKLTGEKYASQCGKKTHEIVKYAFKMLETVNNENLGYVFDSEQLMAFTEQSKASLIEQKCNFLETQDSNQFKHLLYVKRDIISQNYGMETLANYETEALGLDEDICTNANKQIVAKSYQSIKDQLGFSDFAGFLVLDTSI